MNSDVEKFIKGESRNSYNYFGAHKVNDGACFRLYAPHAKGVEVVTNEKSYKMDKVDFRGVFEVRIKDIKEFDSYHYEILTNDDAWVNKNDPYTFNHIDNKSLFVEQDDYVFVNEKWNSKANKETNFHACLLNDNFNMDEQRDFIDYLKEYSFNYLIIRPYDEKYLYCVNKLFVNESSLKNFIDNLHQMGIGVIFDFDTSSFYDYQEGLNEFDGDNTYDKKDDKYNDVDRVYFDFSKNHTKSYVTSFVSYYMDKFSGDGLYLNDSDFNKELVNNFENKIVIYKGEKGKKGYSSSQYLDELLVNISEFDHKKFTSLQHDLDSYLLFDYKKYLNLIKGNEETKKDTAKIMMAMAYLFSPKIISVCEYDEEYLKGLKILAGLHKNSKALLATSKRNLFYNGKNRKCFAYEFVSRNDYVMLFLNIGDLKDEKYDLGMGYYGYYTLMYDSKTNTGSDELFSTRGKQAHNKIIAMKLNVSENQVLVYQRMKYI